MKANQNIKTPTVLDWVKDVLLLITGIPLLMAIIYGVAMAYKTYHPTYKEIKERPEDYDLSVVPVKIPVKKDNITLDAWFFPVSGSTHTIIIGHELRARKSAKLQYVKFLHQAGYNILVFDHRNHGQSSADPSFWSMSQKFTDDMEAAILFTQNEFKVSKENIILFSFSFSTFPALYVLLRLNCQVGAIIFDSGPAMNIKNTFRRYLDVSKGLVIPGLLGGPVLYWIVRETYIQVVNRMLAVKWPPKLKNISTQMLFIANEKDPVIPVAEIRQIAAIHPNNQLWVSPGTKHLMAYREHREEYQKLIIDFLNKS